MLGNTDVYLAAGEVVSGALQDYKLEIAFPSEEFTLNAIIMDVKGVETATTVTSIDGQVGVLCNLSPTLLLNSPRILETSRLLYRTLLYTSVRRWRQVQGEFFSSGFT